MISPKSPNETVEKAFQDLAEEGLAEKLSGTSWKGKGSLEGGVGV
jgi:hypothetical protein